MVRSTDLLEHLRSHPAIIKENAHTLLEELSDLGANKPTIIAFGYAAHRLLATAIPPQSYGRLVKVLHYSHQIGKEQYRQAVLKELG